MLARRSWLMLRAIIQAYEGIAGSSLESAIESECSRDLRKGYKAIVRLAGNPGFYYARSIYKAIKGVGTDELCVIRHIVNTSEVRSTSRDSIPNLNPDATCQRKRRILGNSWLHT